MREAKEAGALSIDTKEQTVDVSPRTRAKRPARKPLHDPGRLKFTNLDPNYHYYLIATDKERNGNKMQAFVENYWEPVTRNELYGSDCESPDQQVGVDDASRLRLMKLPKEYHLEDEAKKQEERDSVVKQIKEKAGEFGGLTTDFSKESN